MAERSNSDKCVKGETLRAHRDMSERSDAKDDRVRGETQGEKRRGLEWKEVIVPFFEGESCGIDYTTVTTSDSLTRMKNWFLMVIIRGLRVPLRTV